MPQLPPIAQVLARLQRLLSDPNSGLDDIAELIRLDAALTTRVIQISNSVWFGRGTPCRTIGDAVNRVGFREVYHLVAVVASGAIVAQPLAAYTRDATTMWHESISCAFAAEMLADRLAEDTAVAYTAGLLHSIGRLAINKFALAQGPALKPFADEHFPRDHSSAEFLLLGFTQADVAACMLKKWDFAKTITEPIREQYEPLEAQEPHDRMAAILYGARMLRSVICHKQEFGESAEEDEVLNHLRMSREELLAFAPSLQTQLNRAHQMTKL